LHVLVLSLKSKPFGELSERGLRGKNKRYCYNLQKTTQEKLMTRVGSCMYPLHWKLALRLEKLQPVMKTYRS